jgi:hypothetical protein
MTRQGLLTPKEAADWLHISRSTLYTLPIRRIKIGRCSRYELSDLEVFVALNATREPLPMRRTG